MTEDPKEIERLVPLVKFAYAIYCGTEIELPKPPPTAPLPGAPRRGEAMSEEFYRASVQQDIDEKYSFPLAGFSYMREKVRSGQFGSFSDEDCESAIVLLDVLLGACLEIESAMGEGPEAIKELKDRVPGLPAELYADVMGRIAYWNR